MDKYNDLDTERTMKNIKYYENYYFSNHSTVYMDNYKNAFKGEIINYDLVREDSYVTNNGFNNIIRHIEM